MNKFAKCIIEFVFALMFFFNLCDANELEDRAMVDYLGNNKHLQGKAEIVFLLDRSGSVGSANFEIEKGFVESFLTHIVVDVNASRVAVISYSNTAVLHIDYLREPKTKCFLSQELQDVVFIDSRATNIAAALDKAQIVFQNARPNVNKVAVLISDGFATVGGDPVPHAQRLKDSGVEIFCFGVGKVMKNELLLLATSEKHVYSCSEYKDFQRLARKIRGDPHETSWSGQATTPNCDHMCDSPYKDEPNDPGCCDHNARCSCALLSGMHTCVCGPGYAGLSGLAGDCRACPKGTYKPKLEPARHCIACPKGSTTDREASTSLKDCICKDGYEGDPANGVECTLVNCPPLQNPTNGFLLGNCRNTYGSQCLFMCDEDYELVDKADDMRTCQRDGTWSGKTSRCRRIQCNAPSNPSSGTVNCDDGYHFVGSKCRYSCYRGYLMDGSKERECLTSKRWSGNEVRCIPVTCELPPPLKYGQVYNCKTDVKPVYQETCVFRCNDGFVLEGPTYLYCAVDGKLKSYTPYDNRKPVCKDIQPPEITCPKALLVKAEKGKDGATVDWKIPHPTDNSGLRPKLFSYPIITPPAYLPIERHTVQYVAIDDVGLKSYCNLEIVVYDDEAPKVLKCPSKIEISSDDVVEPAFWEEPLFEDNSKRAVRIRTTHSPGYAFSPGRHTVRYEAFDESNNKAECVFDVIMTRNSCPYYPPPSNGALSCDDLMFGELCQVLCNDKYDFVEKPAEWYVCNSHSKWMTIPEYMPFPWPDCAKPALPGIVRHMMRGFYYQGDCNDPQVQIQIKKMFLEHLMNRFQKGGVCVHRGTCNLETVRVKCGRSTTDPSLNRRMRRDVWEHAFREELELEFEITIDVDQELNDTEAVLANFLETIQNLRWDADEDFQQTTTLSPFVDGTRNYSSNAGTVVITEEKTEMVCKPGAVLNQDLCVLCAPGTYYDSSVQECVDCPLGHYQEEEGQLRCEKCPVGMSTEYRRSRNATDCKAICLPGTYSQSGLETCMSCAIGSFQEHVGQHICELCPGRTTTATVQSTSFLDCRETCDPGSFSESGLKPCDLCPIGHYQPSSGQRVCIDCPTNFTTLTTGSTDASQCLDLDPCSDELICWNGGQCKRIGREAICICLEGFEGKRCEEDVNECDQEPCYNGGHCFNVDGSFYCNCSDGFTGPLCEVEVNECSSSPCLNNGTCLDKVNDYACVCPAGFEGRSCEREQEICSHDIICLNGGSCVPLDSNDSYSVCSCPPGYTGVDCALDIDECEEATCYNNASCVDAIASYTCVCTPGYTGAYCETEVDECENNQCWSGSTCRNLIGTYECLCPPGWGGTLCDTKLNDDFVLNFPDSTATIANMATMKLNSPLSDVTVSMWVQTTDTEHSGTPMSYAVASASTTDGDGETVVDNALTISDCSGIHVYVNNEPLVTDVQVSDGQWHHLAFSWSSQNSGEWTLYKDGKLQTNGTHLRPQDVVLGGGTMVIGQEQDTVGGGFSPIETFTGNITRVNVWNSYFSKSNITRLCQLEDDIPGKVIAWPDFLQGIKGNVNVIQNERPALITNNQMVT